MPVIRILLVVAALFLVVFVVMSVRRSKTRIEDSLFWFAISALILILSVFPQIAEALSVALGFQAPINFIYLFFIAVLLIKCFMMSNHISQLETKLKELAQKSAIDRLSESEGSDQNE